MGIKTVILPMLHRLKQSKLTLAFPRHPCEEFARPNVLSSTSNNELRRVARSHSSIP